MKQLIKQIKSELCTLYTESETAALVRILLTELLEFSQTEYLLKDSVTLTLANSKRLSQAIERLKRYEPVQYILGYCDFCGTRFTVTPAVLIPRPETSELVEWVAACSDATDSIADIGTGSGCIAISLAKMLPQAKVTAFDISATALKTARLNNRQANTNVKFTECDIINYTHTGKKFDTIVSNPPYIKECEKKTMEKNVLLWEPHTALFVPDADPLLFYRTIAVKATDMLVPGGKLFFEINREHGNDIVNMLRELGYKNIVLRKDFADNDRMVFAENTNQ